ncbi:MAG: hypothetical protein HWE20_13585 [Gammaproteobacteria bacterium]|nr:hypothetical protein [Gammaproteobacteria bacterium]
MTWAVRGLLTDAGARYFSRVGQDCFSTEFLSMLREANINTDCI